MSKVSNQNDTLSDASSSSGSSENEEIDPKSLLRQILGSQGENESQPGLFNNFGQIVCNDPEVSEWLSSQQNDCFLLRLPPHLHHPLAVSSITESLQSVKPDLHMATAMPGVDICTPHGQGEFLLATLCYQTVDLCSTGDMDEYYRHRHAGKCPVQDLANEILQELETALESYSPGWREQLLWSLLQVYISDAPKTGLALVVDLSSNLQDEGRQKCLSTLQTMAAYVKTLDKHVKILVIVDEDEPTDLDAKSMTVCLENKEIQQSLESDLEYCLSESIADDERAKDEVIATIRRHVHRPLVVFSYLQYIESRLWTTKAQLRDDSIHLDCADSSANPVFSMALEAVHQ